MSGLRRGDILQQHFNRVRYHIEQCLRRNKTKEETMYILSVRFRICPVCTALVWEKLEAENPEFFNNYLMHNQILELNRLRLEMQHVLQREAGMVPNVSTQERSRFRNGNSRRAGFLSQNRNMGLVGRMNLNTDSRTQAESRTRHPNATLLDGDTSAVGSSAQASNLPDFPRSSLIENFPAPEQSNANNIVDSHGDIESGLDPASGS